MSVERPTAREPSRITRERSAGCLESSRLGLGRAARTRTRPGGHVMPPRRQAAPQVLGVDLQRLADVLVGEEPSAIVRRDPLLGLVEQLLAVPVTRDSVLLEA